MKPIRLFIVSAALLILGVWTLLAKFKGNIDIHLGWPLSDTTLQVTGAAAGGWVMAGLLLLVAAALAFLWALAASMFANREETPALPPPPEAPLKP
jgi:hypothetical protein